MKRKEKKLGKEKVMSWSEGRRHRGQWVGMKIIMYLYENATI